ncbi:MAG: CPBP family intramembrane glutamic endopeptidase [Prosthecobacter sp.]
MAAAATIGVLRDLALLVSLATALGLAAYWMLRRWRPHVSWSSEGQVLSSPYGFPDLMILSSLGLFFIFAAMGPTDEKAASGAMTPASLVASMAFNLIVCAGLLVYLHRVRGLNPAELFGLQQVDGRRLFRVVVLFAVVMLIAVNVIAGLTVSWLQDVWPDLEPQDTVKAFQESDGVVFRFLVILAAVVVAPLAEEVMFRGFVYGVLKRYTDAPFAAMTSSLMFAIIHLHVGSLVPLWALALLFCLAYEVTGCLLAPMLLHVIFNGTSITLLHFVPID